MQTLTTTYQQATSHIVVGSGLLNQAGQLLGQVLPLEGARALVVCDQNTKQYADVVEQQLSDAGVNVLILEISAGEQHKNLSTVELIWQACVEAGLTRSDFLISVGGGVAGDLAGFAASTYLRGVHFVQVPTTLLSAVDASVGGKTGFDTAEGKNQIGTFYLPEYVLIDTDTLQTLPARELSGGLAEVIKYTFLAPHRFNLHPEQLASLCAADKPADSQLLEELIVQSLQTKNEFVVGDEHDKGKRKLLNFGHTLGHALEAATNYEQYTHGEAVGIGMLCAVVLGEQWGVTPAQDGYFETLLSLLEAAQLPTTTEVPLELCLTHLATDKKRVGNHLDFVVLNGEGATLYPVSLEKLTESCQAALGKIFVRG